MKKTLTAIPLLLLSFGMTDAGAKTTMRESVHKAVTTNPAVSASESAKKAAEKDIRDARADYFPSLDQTGRTGYAYTRKKFYNKGGLSSARNGEAHRLTGQHTLTLSQIIFNGFARENNVQRAKNAHDTSNSTLVETQEGIAADTAAAFIQVKVQQRLLVLSEDNVKTHEKILRKVRSRVTGGLGTVADTRQVEARLLDAKVATEQIEGELDLAVARFLELVGELPVDLANPFMPVNAIPGTVEEAVAVALAENPTVKVAEGQLRVAESDFELTRAPFWPTIRGEVEGGTEHNIDGVQGDEGSIKVQLVGEYNLYKGGRDTARREAQRHRMAESKYRLSNARRNTERLVRGFWADIQTARDQAVELEKAANINDKLRKDYFVQFDLGDRSLLDVLDAEVAYFRSRSSLVQANGLEDASIAGLLATMARLAKSLDVGQPPANPDSHMAAHVDVHNTPVSAHDHNELDPNMRVVADPAVDHHVYEDPTHHSPAHTAHAKTERAGQADEHQIEYADSSAAPYPTWEEEQTWMTQPAQPAEVEVVEELLTEAPVVPEASEA